MPSESKTLVDAIEARATSAPRFMDERKYLSLPDEDVNRLLGIARAVEAEERADRACGDDESAEYVVYEAAKAHTTRIAGALVDNDLAALDAALKE